MAEDAADQREGTRPETPRRAPGGAARLPFNDLGVEHSICHMQSFHAASLPPGRTRLQVNLWQPADGLLLLSGAKGNSR